MALHKHMKYIQTWNIEKMEWLDQVRSWSKSIFQFQKFQKYSMIVVASPHASLK